MDLTLKSQSLEGVLRLVESARRAGGKPESR
jgi:hypothetical protein